MQYGAYRRWKLAEDSELDSKGKPKKKKSKSSTGYQAGDYKVDGVNGISGGDAIGKCYFNPNPNPNLNLNPL
jgi:hypothetical protein